MVVPVSDLSLPSLTIALFGPVDVRCDAEPLPRLRSRKGYGLLALLTLRPGAEVRRAWLAGLLWPDSPEPQALGSLRITLKDLRHALGEKAWRLQSPSPRTLRLDLAGAAADVPSFDAAIARGDANSLEQAIALYRGPLLEGWTDEWVFQERHLREQSYLNALETLAGQARERGDLKEAERLLERTVAVDPSRETTRRALMQVQSASGNYAAAMRTFHELRTYLHRELYAEPAPETVALFHQLRAVARRRAGGRRRTTDDGARAIPPPVAPPAGSPTPLCREAAAGNLPHSLTSFVGRATEMAEVQQLMDRARLVTITGAGGTGKTRLALEVAASIMPCYPDGVWLVELAPLADPLLVPQAFAAAVRVREEPGCALTDTLIAALKPRTLLLVVDNCEHLVGACARLIETLLRACPHARVLATSRESLNVPGETTYPLGCLAAPDPQHMSMVDGRWSMVDGGAPSRAQDTLPSAFLQFDAVRLFVERAVAAVPSFRITDRNTLAVAQVCHGLDGIPLAIELAAARTRGMSIEQIAARLNDRFRLLTDGSRTALPRQQTLRATIDWSYDLLTEPERTLLRRLSVFAGGWTLEAAEAVCTGEGIGCWLLGVGREAASPVPNTQHPIPPLKDWQVLDLLTRLVYRSLVLYEERGGGGPRYRLLETVRQYARDRLLESGEAERVRGAHRDWFLALAERAEPELLGPKQVGWLRRLDVEHDNLRAALSWSKSASHRPAAGLGSQAAADAPLTEDVEKAFRLAAALTEFWEVRSYWREGLQSLEELLVSTTSTTCSRERARVLLATAQMSWRLQAFGPTGQFQRAISLLEESRALFEELQDKQGIANSLMHLGLVAWNRGEEERARALAEQTLALSRELGNTSGMAGALWVLANIAVGQGDKERGRRLWEEHVALSRQGGHLSGLARGLIGLAGCARAQGETERARTLLEESLLLNRELDDKLGVAFSLHDLGGLAFGRREYEQATTLCRESLLLLRELGRPNGVARAFEMLGRVAIAQDRPERAARLLGAAGAIWETMGESMRPAQVRRRDDEMASLRAALGEDAFTAAWNEGRAVSRDEAIEYALEAGAPPGAARGERS